MKTKMAILALWLSLSVMGQQGQWERSLIKSYEEGVLLFDKEIYGAAADKFTEVMLDAPDVTHSIYVGAEYHKAMCSVYLMNKDAENLVLTFIENHPTSPRVNDAI